jgi:hypothetical protein
MAELNIGALTGSTTYTGSVGTTNIDTPKSCRVRTAHRAPSTLNRNSDLLYLHCSFGLRVPTPQEFESKELGGFKAG